MREGKVPSLGFYKPLVLLETQHWSTEHHHHHPRLFPSRSSRKKVAVNLQGRAQTQSSCDFLARTIYRGFSPREVKGAKARRACKMPPHDPGQRVLGGQQIELRGLREEERPMEMKTRREALLVSSAAAPTPFSFFPALLLVYFCFPSF